jgi:hypothetical protein
MSVAVAAVAGITVAGVPIAGKLFQKRQELVFFVIGEAAEHLLLMLYPLT